MGSIFRTVWRFGPARVLAIGLAAALLIFAILIPSRTNGSEAIKFPSVSGILHETPVNPYFAPKSSNSRSGSQPFDVLTMDKEAKDLFNSVAEPMNSGQFPLDFSESIQRLGKAAEKGNISAEYLLSHIYELGWGTSADRIEVSRWHEKVVALQSETRETEGRVLSFKAYGAAFESFRHAAEMGDASAELYMGLACALGQDVPKNIGEAARWFQKAASQGSTSAENNLGVLYHNGAGIPKDNVTAVQWLQKAAESGNGVAQYNLGRLYLMGDGIPQDFNLASSWLVRAGKQGNERAQVLLSSMFASGNGVSGNLSMAYMWLNLASASDEGARSARDKIEKLVPADQIIEGQRLTREWIAQNQNPVQ